MTGKALTMHNKAQIAIAARDGSISRTGLAAELGMSRQWVTTMIGRYLQDGFPGLEPRSRARKDPGGFGPDVEDEVVRVRKRLEDEGLGHDAARVRDVLLASGITPVPSIATIGRMLLARGVVVAQPKKRPKRSRRFTAASPNECWQIDFTHYDVAGRTFFIMNVLDDHSRVCVASVAATRSSSQLAWQAVLDGADRWGMPAKILSDNGVEFVGVEHRGCMFTHNICALGVVHVNSRPFHPQTCGKVERFHRTVKDWLDLQPRPRSVIVLQAQLDTFVDRYNTIRPHYGIGRRIPTDVWHATPPAMPGPPSIEPRQRLVERRANNQGRIELKPWQIQLGIPYANQPITCYQRDLTLSAFTNHGEHIRTLTIDPTRRYQPLSNK
jgi:transposase InsO family protein